MNSDTFAARLDAALRKCREEVNWAIREKRSVPVGVAAPDQVATELAPVRTASASVEESEFRVRIELELKKLRDGPPADPASQLSTRKVPDPAPSDEDLDGNSGIFHLPGPRLSVELARLIGAWPKLNPAARAAILRIARV